VVHNADVTAQVDGYGDGAELIRAATGAATKRNDSDARKECLARGTCLMPMGGGMLGGTTFIRSTQMQGTRRPDENAAKSKATKKSVSRKEFLQTFELADDASKQSADTADEVAELKEQVANMRTVLKAMRPEE
jgi:hypothetical protein